MFGSYSRKTLQCLGIALALNGTLPFALNAQDNDASNTAATPDTSVAGRTLEQWAEACQSDNRVVRLRAVKTLGVYGESALPVLVTVFESPDPAMQYTALVHWGRISKSTAQKPSEAVLDSLSQLRAQDDHPGVQMAAAYALCCVSSAEDNLKLLMQRLSHPERGMACSAAELLGMLGDRAKSATGALEAAYDANRPGGGGDYHVGGACQNALRKITPQWQPRPANTN